MATNTIFKRLSHSLPQHHANNTQPPVILPQPILPHRQNAMERPTQQMTMYELLGQPID